MNKEQTREVILLIIFALSLVFTAGQIGYRLGVRNYQNDCEIVSNPQGQVWRECGL